MALHGEIKVNRYAIGDWAAVRKELIAGDWHNYDCSVSIIRLGEPWGNEPAVFEFCVPHSYADGALVLAAKVLLEANKRLNNG